MKKLFYFRLFFILYFLVKIIIDLVFGYKVYEDTLENVDIPDLMKSPVTFIITTLLSNGILLLIGLLVIHFLLQKKNWARILLLVVGFLNILDALSSLIFNSSLPRILKAVFSIAEWEQIIYLDRVTDIVGLVFWGYAAYILLIDTSVKKMFAYHRE